MILLASPARAGCNFTDLAGAVKQSVSATMTCRSACQDEATCGAAIWLVAVLTALAMEGAQDKVDSFCAQAQGTLDQIISAATVLDNPTVKEYLGDHSSELAAAGAAANVVRCACATEHSNVASE